MKRKVKTDGRYDAQARRLQRISRQAAKRTVRRLRRGRAALSGNTPGADQPTPDTFDTYEDAQDEGLLTAGDRADLTDLCLERDEDDLDDREWIDG